MVGRAAACKLATMTPGGKRDVVCFGLFGALLTGANASAADHWAVEDLGTSDDAGAACADTGTDAAAPGTGVARTGRASITTSGGAVGVGATGDG